MRDRATVPGMPELPDVVLYIEALEKRIQGQPLERVRLASPFLLRTVEPLIGAAHGKRVRRLRRLGKRIAIGLEDDLWLVLHLMINGRLHWKEPGARLACRYALAAFDFPNGTLTLTEFGPRKRASLHLVRGEAALLGHDPGGLDVFEIDLDAFRAALARENHTLKRALTDPRLLSGIGNAYSDEILHRVRLSPLAMTEKLSPDGWSRQYAATRATLAGWTELDSHILRHIVLFQPGSNLLPRPGLCLTRVEWYMRIALQVPIFIVLMLAYTAIIRSVSVLPSIIVGMILGAYYSARGRKPSPAFSEALAYFSGGSAIVLAAAFLTFFVWLGKPALSDLEFWNNAVLMGFVLFASTMTAASTFSDHPMLREAGRAALISSLIILLAILMEVSLPHATSTETIRFSIIAAAIFFILVSCAQTSRQAKGFGEFEELNKRHDGLLTSLHHLERVAFLIGDSTEWKAVRSAMEESQRLSKMAFDALRAKRFRDADAAMIQAEVEATHIQDLFNTRLRLTLSDDLEARLRQAGRELEEMREDFRMAGLSASHLDDLITSLEDLAKQSFDVDCSYEELVQQLERYDHFLREVKDTQTALRFRRGVGGMIDDVRREAEERSAILSMARALEINANAAQTARAALEEALGKIESPEIQDSGSLVETYQSVQDSRRAFDSAIAGLGGVLDRGWTRGRLAGDKIELYVPKACSTKKSSAGIAVLDTDGVDTAMTLELNGTLVEDFPARLTLSRANPRVSFNFVGKRGGKGKLKFNLANGIHAGDKTFDIKVMAALGESTQTSFIIGTAVGGVTGLVFWWYGKDMEIAGPLGVGAGLVLAALSFTMRYLRYGREV